MSTEAVAMRRAAARIRHDVEYGQAHGDDAFLFAVADWLDNMAERAARNIKPELYLHNWTHALAVARAYLGESA